MMEIRKTSKYDLRKISEIFAKGFYEYPYNEKWTKKNAMRKVTFYFKNGKSFVALDNGIIVGFIFFSVLTWDTHNVMFIDEFVVDSKYRGRGIGTSLLEKVEKIAEKKGVNHLQLISNTKSKAFNLYLNKGYRKSDLVVMNKVIK